MTDLCQALENMCKKIEKEENSEYPPMRKKMIVFE